MGRKLSRKQRAADRAEAAAFGAYLADPRSKTDQHAAYADHYGQWSVALWATSPDGDCTKSGDCKQGEYCKAGTCVPKVSK